mmetsp:Transcript_31873/g.90534  ORF Transcript_31873/g.90534 Transcript_31873/m.90534 type:complete len:298 (-) Transcript_31873:42-935(-)
MPFGQLVIGPPGSGKTTYCSGMKQLMEAMGRKVAVINLDPANDPGGYDPAIDLQDLVSLDVVQEELRLGPNGGLIYSMEYLAKNVDWLKQRLKPLEESNTYILFDLPGQVELFCLHTSLKSIIKELTGQHHYSLTAVHLVDSHLCTDPAKFISALTLSLSTMLHLELPHINVMSKLDLIESYGELPLPLEFFTEVQDLSYLVDQMVATSTSSAFAMRHKKLTAAICEVVEDFGLVHFMPLAIEDKDLAMRVLTEVDKANGYAFAHAPGNDPCPQFSYGSANPSPPGLSSDISDKYVK